MKKQIRVLTGYHAGARLDLNVGNLIIGREANADIQLSDWTGASLELLYREDGVVTLDTIGKGRTSKRMRDHVPRHLNHIVLCVGPADDPWPADTELLATMFEMARSETDKRRAPVKQRSYTRWIRWSSAGLAIATVSSIVILAASEQASRATGMRNPEALHQAAQHANLDVAIDQLKEPDVRVIREGNSVVVTGIVRTWNRKAKIEAAVRRLGNLSTTTRVVVADNVVDELQWSLGEPEVRVSYLGDGTFKVAGVTRNVADVQKRVERVRADFGASIRHVMFELQARTMPDTNVSSMMATDSVQYVELADGTKSLAAFPAVHDQNIESGR